MEIQLTAAEARVLGSLVEKDLTTPDYYPLTLNALTNACNQKSNRDPVVAFEEADVVRALDGLRHKGLAMQAHGEGSRVPKYRHSLAEKLHLERDEQAVLAELLLRGPQTLGELRTRAERMAPLPSLEEVERILGELMERQPPLTVKLPRQPGRKEHRFAHLLCGEPELSADDTAPSPEAATLQMRAENERLASLEAEVASLRGEVAELRAELEKFRRQFE